MRGACQASEIFKFALRQQTLGLGNYFEEPAL